MCSLCDIENGPPEPHKVILLEGIMRRLYVDRGAAKRQEPCIVVALKDDPNAPRYYARNVEWTGQGQYVTEFKWTGSNDVAPALWIETDAELELTL